MNADFHGKTGIPPNVILGSISGIDLDRIAFGFHYFPETGFADFFACDKEDLISLSEPLEIVNFAGNSCFVAFPFQRGATGYLIPPALDLDNCISKRFVVKGLFREAEEAEESILTTLHFDEPEDYKNRVSYALEAIKNGQFEKVVLSRSFRQDFSKENLTLFLQRILENYPEANLMIFNIPGKGLWISASPELLLSYGYAFSGIARASIVSQALAGTRPKDSDLPWDEKEMQEHALVASFVESKMALLAGPESIQKWGPGEQLAGKLRHLSSIFHINGGNSAAAIQLASELHPTPAVCGFPPEPALGWLIEHENLDRSFFAGFSGSMHPERIKFIVNLRTACFRDESLIFYAGAGIVQNSDPEAELQETDAKINTLRNLI
jgi:isochorismate synthase